jgi:hypothetical protein
MRLRRSRSAPVARPEDRHSIPARWVPHFAPSPNPENRSIRHSYPCVHPCQNEFFTPSHLAEPAGRLQPNDKSRKIARPVTFPRPTPNPYSCSSMFIRGQNDLFTPSHQKANRSVPLLLIAFHLRPVHPLPDRKRKSPKSSDLSLQCGDDMQIPQKHPTVTKIRTAPGIICVRSRPFAAQSFAAKEV